LDLELILRKQLYVWNNNRAIDDDFFKEYKTK
jgi:hypothetical protein